MLINIPAPWSIWVLDDMNVIQQDPGTTREMPGVVALHDFYPVLNRPKQTHDLHIICHDMYNIPALALRYKSQE